MTTNSNMQVSLQIAELLAAMTIRLSEVESNEEVDDLRRYLGMAESVARRWYLREGLDADLVDIPEIRDLEEEMQRKLEN